MGVGVRLANRIGIVVILSALLPTVVLDPPSSAVSAKSTTSVVRQIHGWAGQQVTSSTGDIWGAFATWTVPKVSCPPSGGPAISVWVGIGGSTIEDVLYQTGVIVRCNGGSAAYFGFAEVFNVKERINQAARCLSNPLNLKQTCYSVDPGDRIEADVVNERHTDLDEYVRYSISDYRNGKRIWYSSDKLHPRQALSHNSECVVEDPQTNGAALFSLAPFTPVVFSSCDSSTASGHLYDMSSGSQPRGWKTNALVMDPDGTVLAKTTYDPLTVSEAPLPPIPATTQAADELEVLLKQAGLWTSVAPATQCAEVDVYGALTSSGDADLTIGHDSAAGCSMGPFGTIYEIRRDKIVLQTSLCDCGQQSPIYAQVTSPYHGRQTVPFSLDRNGDLAPGSETAASPPASSTPTTAPNRPTLGLAWQNSGGGYGSVEPTLVSNGGDPTGVVSRISWQSWGGPQATGTGTSDYVGAGQTVAGGTQESVTIIAFDLGSCAGIPAYQAVEWFYPQHGQSFSPTNFIYACSGSYSGGGFGNSGTTGNTGSPNSVGATGNTGSPNSVGATGSTGNTGNT